MATTDTTTRRCGNCDDPQGVFTDTNQFVCDACVKRLLTKQVVRPGRAGGNIAALRELMHAGRWRAAVLMAARFQRLGPYRDRVLSAREAYMRPAFQQQLGKNPHAAILDGIAALEEGWGTEA